MSIRVAILTNIIPSYREGFYSKVFGKPEFAVTVVCQENIPDSTYSTIHDKFPGHVCLVPFWHMLRGAATWQFLPYRKLLKDFDVYFVDGNPRFLNHALFASIAGLMGRKVVIWSMVHSYHNNSFTKRIRLSWLRLFKNHFLYNDSEIVSLTELGFRDKNVMAMNNGLDQDNIDRVCERWTSANLAKWQLENGLAGRTVIVSSGRLLDGKYDSMIEALPLLVAEIPSLLWCVIGDGEDYQRMQTDIAKVGLSENVRFVGSLYDEEKLAPWLLSASIFVHPCAVGLSILHAFGYGLPFITHSDKSTHGPEFVAFEEGKTGLTYKKGNSGDLANKICQLLASPDKRAEMSQHALSLAKNKYNINVMADRFFAMVNLVCNSQK